MFPKQSVNTPTNIVTSGSSILMGNGSGGVANVTVGANLTFTGGVLTGSPSGGSASVRGVVDVTDYGAVGNAFTWTLAGGSVYNPTPTNDDAAFAAALATGCDVYIPRIVNGVVKNYYLTQTITPLPGQAIIMQMGVQNTFSDTTHGIASSMKTLGFPLFQGGIVWASTNTVCISLQWFNCRAENVHIVQHQSFPPVAGNAHFAIGTPTTSAFGHNYMNCYNCTATGAWVGFWLRWWQSFCTIENCINYRADYAGFWINLAVPQGAFLIRNCKDQASSQNSAGHLYTAIGLLVTGTDTANIDGFYCLSSVVRIGTDDLGSVDQLTIRNLNIEPPNGYPRSLEIGRTSSAVGTTVQNIYFTDVEVISGTLGSDTSGWQGNVQNVPGPGPTVYLGATTTNISFNEGWFRGCGYEDYGMGNSCKNINFDSRGHYDGTLCAALYGDGGSFTGNRMYNWKNFIDHNPTSPSIVGAGWIKRGYQIAHNTAFASPYSKTPSNPNGNVTIGINTHQDYGVIMGNDMGICNTPVQKTGWSTSYISPPSRAIGNIGGTDW